MIRKIFCIGLSLILLSSCSNVQATLVKTENIVNTQSDVQKTELPMQCIYYDNKVFANAMTQPAQYSVEGKLIAGMIPHHLIAADMISGFFSLASKQEQDYETVLLISTSHFPENCNSNVVTSTANWNTPYGILKTDVELTEKILKNQIIDADNSREDVEFDHGISSIIPFINYYLPNSKVAVCMLSNSISSERLSEVQSLIAELQQEKNILLVASVDCSHYLNADEAEIRDVETAKAIESFDFNKIMRFTDSNIDSPQSVGTMLKAVQNVSGKLMRLDHSSSVEKLPHALTNPIYDEGITSYYVYGAWVE